MNHKQLQEFLPFTHRNRVPIMLWGPTGIGKTTGIYEYGKKVGAKVITLHLASQEPGDLVGLPSRLPPTKEDIEIAKARGEEAVGKTVWLRPEWLPDADDDGKFIFFLDEFNRGPKYVLSCMFPFLLEGRLHTHKVPKNSWIIAAGNPADDNYDVTEIHDKALISRLCHIRLTPEHQEWLDKHDGLIDAAIHSVVAKEPTHLGFDSCDLGFKIEPDARALTNLGLATKDMKNEEFNAFGFEFAEGCVGPTFASMWVQERKKMLISISPEDILKKYSVAKSNVKKTVLEISSGSNIRNDVLGGANRKLVSHIKKREKKLGKKEIENLGLYIKDIPRDSAQSLLVMLSADEILQYVVRKLSEDNDLYGRMMEANSFNG